MDKPAYKVGKFIVNVLAKKYHNMYISILY